MTPEEAKVLALSDALVTAARQMADRDAAYFHTLVLSGVPLEHATYMTAEWSRALWEFRTPPASPDA